MSPVIIVTGANKGIGYEISKKLIADGAKVIMTARDQARLDEAANKLKPFGAVKLDVTDDASVEEAKREISRLAPAIDGLV
ncbi:carbonyl reductase, putative, partial [Perkinsus marinus ATCC 50983]